MTLTVPYSHVTAGVLEDAMKKHSKEYTTGVAGFNLRTIRGVLVRDLKVIVAAKNQKRFVLTIEGLGYKMEWTEQATPGGYVVCKE